MLRDQESAETMSRLVVVDEDLTTKPVSHSHIHIHIDTPLSQQYLIVD